MKTLFWVLGKPGCGKTTVANLIETLEGANLFSYGRLLEQVQPQPDSGGYKIEDYKKVVQVVTETSFVNPNIIVDGNPYSKEGFESLSQIGKSFDEVKLVHLIVSDETASQRLESRSLPIHDEEGQQVRIDNFNQNLLPMIIEYGKRNRVIEIDTEELPPDLIVSKILSDI